MHIAKGMKPVWKATCYMIPTIYILDKAKLWEKIKDWSWGRGWIDGAQQNFRIIELFLHDTVMMDACMHVCSPVSNSLLPHGLQPARLLCPWNFPGKSTEVGSHFFLQGIFPTQGSNPWILAFLLWQACSLPLSHLGPTLMISSWLYHLQRPYFQIRSYSQCWD